MRSRILALFATVAPILVQFAVATPADAAITAAARYTASTRVESTPDQTLTYSVTLTRSGIFSRLFLPLPPRAGTSGLSIHASNIRGAVLETVSGGFVVRARTPYGMSRGKRLWVMINGIRTPPASTASVTVTALSTSDTVLARGTTPALTFIRARPCPSAWPQDYVTTENDSPGTTGWPLAVSAYDPAAAAGFVSRTSAACGDTITFRVTSSDYHLGVSIYRMGYYGGAGARLVWASQSAVRGIGQRPAQMVGLDPQGRQIDMPTARNWIQTFSVRIDGTFPPGVYLAKITGVTTKKGSFVPFIVRDGSGRHDELVLDSVGTWQAYNTYGGASAYTTPLRSTRVSLDRPLLQNQGTGDFLSLEYGFVYWAEKQGFDLNYAADTDLHGRPDLVDRAGTVVLMPHTEYWSTRMRTTMDAAVAGGKNLASFGANQGYWRIDPQPSPVTGADREYEIFRAGDTSRFRDEPAPNPEQSLFGAMFGCQHMDGTGVPNGSWLWQGVNPSAIPHLAQGEVDYVHADFPRPPGLQVLTTMSLDACNTSGEPRADIVAVDTGTGGRVFNASTHSWVCMLYGHCPWAGWSPTEMAQVQVGQATMNAFSWLDAGSALSALGVDTAGTPLSVFRPQRVGWLQPLSGLPPLEPPPTLD